MKWREVYKIWTRSIYVSHWFGQLVIIVIKTNRTKLLEKYIKFCFSLKKCLFLEWKPDILHFTSLLKLLSTIVQRNNKISGNGYFLRLPTTINMLWKNVYNEKKVQIVNNNWKIFWQILLKSIVDYFMSLKNLNQINLFWVNWTIFLNLHQKCYNSDKVKYIKWFSNNQRKFYIWRLLSH